MKVNDEAVARDDARVGLHCAAFDVRPRDVPEEGEDGLARLGARADDVVHDAEKRDLRELIRLKLMEDDGRKTHLHVREGATEVLRRAVDVSVRHVGRAGEVRARNIRLRVAASAYFPSSHLPCDNSRRPQGTC